MTAKMIPVIPITDAMLVSSTVPENDFPAWAAGTTYNASTKGTPVKVIKGHQIWESVQGGNTGNDPEDDGSEWWVAMGATNRWRAFDGYIQDKSKQAESLNWVIKPGQINSSVSLFDMQAAEVVITVTHPTLGEIFNETYPLIDNSDVIDAWTYFTLPIARTPNLTVTDMPSYSVAEISITLNNPNTTASVGQITIGQQELLGRTLNEIPLGIDDYTRLNEDQFGRTTPVIRGYARTATPAVMVDSVRVPYLERRIAEQRGVPTVWAFDTRYGENALAYYGFFRSFSFLYQYSEKTILDLEIRSLV